MLGAVGAVVGVLALWFLVSLFQPFAGDGEGEVRLTIPTGTGIGEVADLLEQRGVISSAFFFELRARTTGQSGDVKQGTFTLKRDMSYTAALDAITTAPKADVVDVTVPEGQSRREVAPIVRQAGLPGSYTRLTRSSPLLDPRDYGAKGARSLEGFLFPSTYELKKGATARTLIRDQLRTFKREFRKVDMRAARRRNLTRYEVLIIASMVEREASLDRERPLVASVITNRIRENIRLGIDATIRFATGNWTRPLRESELAIASPYNTREIQGLPPGPIGSPGLASIRAAANPARTKFLYYVVKPGACNEHAFSDTDAQFQRDVERYNSEREARGGKSPDSCPE
ncbi:MAG: endolytic transglycosylase MltG [Thermoleophilaceae bacterium]